MKKTIPELFEESRRNYTAKYNGHKVFDHVWLQDGNASIMISDSGSVDVSLEELHREYLLIVRSVAYYHVMCAAIRKDHPDLDELVRKISTI